MSSYRKIPLVPGEYFHIYNRGNSKQIIFLDDEDRDRFTKLLYLCNTKKGVNFRSDIVDPKIDAWDFDRGETLVSIGSWTLMPNHFHIYITSPTLRVGEEVEGGRITLFMNKLCTAYVKYLNKKYDRTGSLFEGTFKANHVKNDVQAKYLFSYIHLNSVKLIDPNWRENGIKDLDATLEFLNSYKWSSHADHRGFSRPENKILDLDAFPKYFSDIKDFDSEILSWIQLDEDEEI